MSNAAKDHLEIEDVLSRIRRLVAEERDETPAPVAEDVEAPDVTTQAEAPEPVPAPTPHPKLVLTDAQRVTDAHVSGGTAEADQPPAETRAAEATQAPSEPPKTPLPWAPSDRLMDFSTTAWKRPDDTGGPEGGASENAAQTSASETVPFTAGLDDQGFEPEVGDTNWPDPDADQALRAVVGARTGGLEAGADAQPVDDVADEAATQGEPLVEPTAEVTADVRGAPAALSQEEHSTTAPEDDEAIKAFTRPIYRHVTPEQAPAPAATPAAEDIPESAPETDAATSTPQAEQERTVETFTPRTEPVASASAEDVAADASPAADMPKTAEPSVSATATTGHDLAARTFDEVDDLGPDTDAFPDLDPMTIDEESLRDLIAEVVQEELRGVLGQRITRNVRKMVRREIRLALTAETFD